MSVIGIIAEYNPFHKGHLHQITQIRSLEPDAKIVVVMSGDYVQRGQPAIVDKYTRTRMALTAGASMVIELPVCFSAASAEIFARGGVGLLSKTGITDGICFGSEEGPSPLFSLLSDLFAAEPPAYRDQLKKALKEGLSFPAAREQAAARTLAGSVSPEKLHDFLSAPNNILGLEYLGALKKSGSSMRILPVLRTGMAYNDPLLREDQLPSASAIRSALARGQLPEDALTSETAALLREAADKNALCFSSDLDDFLRCRLMLLDPDHLPQAADLSPQLMDRILKKRYAYTSFEAFADLLKTRETTRSRICRALLHLLLEIRENPGDPSYIRILGFRKEDSGLVSLLRRNAQLPVITRPARERSLLSGEGLRCFEENTRASCLYESLKCRKTGEAFIHEYQRSLILV